MTRPGSWGIAKNASSFQDALGRGRAWSLIAILSGAISAGLYEIVEGICVQFAGFRSQRGGSAKHSCEGRTGYSDKGVESSVREALDRNSALGLIDAQVTRGFVVLTGTAEHYQDKVEAEAMRRQVPGVRSVRNEISLTTPAVDDVELESRLQDRLRYARADVGLSFPQVQVEVHQGVVSLTGTVKDATEHAAVLALAGSTDGVMSVKDRMTVHPDFLNDGPVRAWFDSGRVMVMGSVADQRVKEELLSKLRDVSGVVLVEDELITRDSKLGMKDVGINRPGAPCAGEKAVLNASQ